MNEIHTDCRSETGITVGLIDAVITMIHLLAQRDLSAPEVQEALKDLRSDEDLAKILHEAGIIEVTVGSAGEHTFGVEQFCSTCGKHLDWGQLFFREVDTGGRICVKCAEITRKLSE